MIRQSVARIETMWLQTPNILQFECRRCRYETDLLYYRTPIGGRGPRLLWLLWAEFSESS